jgi:hypothetical protein
LRRRYYYCAACAAGFTPRDAVLGLDAGATTVAVRQQVAALAAHLPFAPAAALLAQLTGVQLGVSTVERIAVAVGTALRADQQATAARHRAGRGPVVRRKPRRLYVSVDGIFAPWREPWQQDGAAGALVCRFGECKTAVVYEARPAARGDTGVRWREYVATFGPVETFGPLVATLAHGCGHHFAREVVFLADGAPYNWTLAAAHFPGAIQIVDFMHAVQHLAAVGQAVWGEQAPTVAAWVHARKADLLADRITTVVAAIAALPAVTAAQQAARKQAWGYFTRNAARMRYGTFRRQGYQIATGVMEAGCKHVVHQRLDQAGMHWRVETAEAIVALRAAVLSAQGPDLRSYCMTTH